MWAVGKDSRIIEVILYLLLHLTTELITKVDSHRIAYNLFAIAGQLKCNSSE